MATITTINYPNAVFKDQLDTLRSDTAKKFTDFVKTVCENSLCHLEVVLKRDEYGNSCFTINGCAPKVFTGYNYVFCVKLFIDTLTAIGYFE